MGITYSPVSAPGNAIGLLANRPSASAVPAGYRYRATDDNGGTVYESDGSAWDIAYPRGIVLMEAKVAADAAAQGSGDIPGLSGSFVGRGLPFILELILPKIRADSGGYLLPQILKTSDSSVVAQRLRTGTAAVPAFQAFDLKSEQIASVAGTTYGYKANLQVQTGTVTPSVATTPMILRAIECK